MNDVAANKIQNMQRFVLRAREVYAADPDGFAADALRQDAAMLNVVRACQQSIDLANHAIKSRKLGIPTSSAESFDLLRAAGVIDAELSERLQKMVGFRNVIAHHYQPANPAIVRAVIASGLDDLVAFGDRVLAFLEGPEK